LLSLANELGERLSVEADFGVSRALEEAQAVAVYANSLEPR
jgi:hypothetical protein